MAFLEVMPATRQGASCLGFVSTMLDRYRDSLSLVLQSGESGLGSSVLPVGTVADPREVLLLLRLAEDEQVFVHDEQKPIRSCTSRPAPRVLGVVLRFDDLLFEDEAAL